MRHRVAGRKLGRTTSHRTAMLRNMVTSLFVHERIRTTDAKAKELRRVTDQMISLAKRGDLHARRQALSVVKNKGVTHKLFAELAHRYQNIAGGYSRVVKLGPRRGDGAMMSIVELVEPPSRAPGRRKRKTKQAAKKTGTKRTEKEGGATSKAPKKAGKSSGAKQASGSERESTKPPSESASRTSGKSSTAEEGKSETESAKDRGSEGETKG